MLVQISCKERRELLYRLIITKKVYVLPFLLCIIWLGNNLVFRNISLSTPMVTETINQKYKRETYFTNFHITTSMLIFGEEYKFHLCDCIRKGKILGNKLSRSLQSTCSDYSTQRGTKQRIISYSYYNNGTVLEGSLEGLRYLESLRDRARQAKNYYNGWIIRVYTNIQKYEEYERRVLCEVYCNNDHVDLCDVTNLPVLGNAYAKHNGMFWRFLPMGDPTVELFVSRDVDSVIQSRELDAVKEWLRSKKAFHIMRDHPTHISPLLGGLWGAKNINTRKMKVLREKLFETKNNHSWGYDQDILSTILWPYAKDDILQHDSFLCKLHNGSKPFPKKRLVNVYVGWGPHNYIYPLRKFHKQDCPLECRKHPDWNRC